MKGLDFLPEYRDWSITPEHTGKQHWYRVTQPNGESGPLYPSVTTVLGIIDKSAPLVGWAKRVSLEKVRATLYEQMQHHGCAIGLNDYGDIDRMLEEARQRPDVIRDEAASEGTDAHSLIDATLRGQEPEIPEALKPAVDGALEFIREFRLTPIASEVSVWHPERKYAGTVDLVAGDTAGRLVVVDWKRSRNGPYKEAAYQVSAYACAITSLTGKPVQKCYVVKLPRTAEEEAFEYQVLNHSEWREAAWVYFSAQSLWEQTRHYRELRKHRGGN